MDQIIQGGYFRDRPEELANMAYTYALASVDGATQDPESFLRAAHLYYHLTAYPDPDETVAGAGAISAADEARVTSVFAHHCVGLEHHCRTWHRLPGSPLPVAKTEKSTLGEHGEQLVRVQEMRHLGDPQRDLLDADYHPDASLLTRLTAEDQAVIGTVEIPENGYYSVRAAARAPTADGASAWLQFGGMDEVQQVWHGAATTSAWQWGRPGPLFFLRADEQPLRIGHRERIELDTLLVAYEGTVPGDGLVVHQEFEGDLADDSGSGNNGLADKPKFGRGKFGRGFAFDGRYTKVRIPDFDGFVRRNAATVSFWLNNGGEQAILAPEEAHGQILKSSLAEIRLTHKGDVEGLGLSAHAARGQWAHFVFVVEDDGVARLYVNGEEHPKTFVSFEQPATKEDLFIGSDEAGRFVLNADLDQLLVYDRALSYSEVADIVALGRRATGRPLTPAARQQ